MDVRVSVARSRQAVRDLLVKARRTAPHSSGRSLVVELDVEVVELDVTCVADPSGRVKLLLGCKCRTPWLRGCPLGILVVRLVVYPSLESGKSTRNVWKTSRGSAVLRSRWKAPNFEQPCLA